MISISNLKKYFELENGIETDLSFRNIYIGDVLSLAISQLKEDSLWLTMQNNINVCAVAVLREVKVILITSGIKPDNNLLTKSIQENIPIYTTNLDHFQAIKLLIKNEDL
ncbi:DRTGG domain-containing protein [Caldicellulosiruptoraceae bacterium PP1]